MTSDRIAVRGLRARGRHGVLALERQEGQEFVVDAVLTVDTRAAARSDALADTVDYSALAGDLVAVVEGEPVDLIETLAQRLADICLADPRVEAVEITVHKPAAPVQASFDDITVTIERRRATAVVSLGSNLGDRAAGLQSAVDALAGTTGVDVLAVSSVYETAPVGGPEQPDYLNACALVSTVLSPEELLAAAQSVEARLGRVRAERWGARVVDVDIVDYSGVVRAGAELALPHPRAWSRAFVLTPWDELLPGAVAADGMSVARALAAVGTAGVRRTDVSLSLGADS